MTKVKSFLLGSAAGVVAVAGAQAADMPVKAKPVEYVKICSLYGDGFFYLPGTETCIRLGGSVQADYYYNAVGNGHGHYDAAPAAQDRSVSAHATRGRIDLGLDSRSQTPYGTLRTYQVYRIDNADQGTISVNNVRGFIQWAGFTFGHTRSYADHVGGWGGGDGMKSLFQGQLHADSGANGTNQISYTWELGNGSVLVIGADERRNGSLANLSNAGVVSVGNAPTTSRAGMNFPDPYVAFRMTQAWGSFSTTIHTSNNNALYYTAVTPGFPACLGTAGGPTPAVPAGPQAGGTALCDHPKDRMGWASMNGIEIKTPWIAAGDRFAAFVNYGQGASGYVHRNLGSPGLFGGGNNVALGFVTDGVYLNGLGIQQTTQWSVAAAYEHWWTPQLSSTVYGGVGSEKYNATVVNGGWFCGKGGAAAQGVTQVNAALLCDPQFKYSTINFQTSWYPVPAFRLAVEVAYVLIDTAMAGQQLVLAPTQGRRPTGVYTARDQGIGLVAFRAQRGFGGVGE
jgi:Porin subfamily